MRAYAAVIEWPMDDAQLILSRTPEGRFDDVRAAVTHMLEAVVPEVMPTFRTVVASAEAVASESLGDWITLVMDADDAPWVTAYDTEL